MAGGRVRGLGRVTKRVDLLYLAVFLGMVLAEEVFAGWTANTVLIIGVFSCRRDAP